MDLDDEELKATRKLNGVAKESNIEEDIKRCEKLIEPQNANWIGITNQLAIAHLIEKVKELRAMCEEYCPKTERIKELEEENAQLEAIKDEAIKRYNFESIPVQKVKVKIEELDIAILECEYDDDDVEEYKNDVEKEKRILLIKKSALEELLEEK